MDVEIAQLAQMRQIAFDLGMAFGKAAMAEDDLDRKLTLFDAYHRSFASVRLSIALKMRIEREARRPEPQAERPDTPERPESQETERPERFDERERDRERVSLPILLRTLTRVADDAQTLLPQAAELPTLRELLARVKATPPAPASSAPATAPRPAPSPLRTRLSGGTAALTLTAPARPGLPGLLATPPRRSTGPPHR